ncbi:MAG: hypothetical protein J5894_03575 [Clostridia bacterium]|nr:hypothetical protein [Clostridia bacterium]
MKTDAWRKVGKVIKYIALVFVFAVTGFIIFRMLSSGDPNEVKTLLVNKNTYDAYVESGETLDMFYQEHSSITRGDENYGYFSVSQVAFIGSAKQVQLVFRYNNSTLRSVAKDLSLAEVPSRDDDIFDVTLVVSRDLTPEDKTDNDVSAKDKPGSVAETRYFASQSISATKLMYNYRKFVFDGVEIDENTLAVYVDIYYKGGDVTPDYEKTPYGTLCIYDYASQNLTRKFTNDDKNAILEWGKENGY